MIFTKFKEEYVFLLLKDKCFKNATECKGRIVKKFKNVDVDAIYRRIVNYQIKKYGRGLYTRSYSHKDMHGDKK